ncbi:MAG TPA: hypothetical protein VD865_04865 [Stenotrophomonas sp.]|nr:hypothetical protein [Stenotrophomonas sp.]
MRTLNVLVVEDSPSKREKIVGAILDAGEHSLAFAASVIEAKKLLTGKLFDILVLDLALPNYPDEKQFEDAGANLLRELQDYDLYTKPHYVIGVTGYADLSSRYEEDFAKRFWQLIYADAASSEWLDKISAFVRHIQLLSLQASESSVVDVAVMTALADERDAILQLPYGWSEPIELDSSTYYHLGILDLQGKKLSVAVVCALRMGPVPAAVLASKIVSKLRPKVFGMTGICAGVKGEANLGDIIVATETFAWEAGKLVGKSEDAFLPELNSVGASETVLSKMQLIQNDREWLDLLKRSFAGKASQASLSIRLGPMATGSPVVSDSEIVSRIVGVNRKTIAIEMEAYAALYAARSWSRHPPLLFCFKSVSDFATEEKDDSVRAYASYTSAQALGRLLVKFGGDLV